MFFIYKIINTVNGKIYIGKTSNIKQRWVGHVSSSRNKTTFLARAIHKYGKDAFIIEEIEQHIDEETAYKRESYWIKELNSRNPKIGYNLAEGGMGGFCGVIPGDDSRKKMSEASKARVRKPHTEEAKKIIKEKRAKQVRKNLDIGLKNDILDTYRTNNYTKKQVAEMFDVTLSTIKSIIRQGAGKDKFEKYQIPEERRKQISKNNIGLKRSDETKEKLSKSKLGKELGAWSLEQRAKTSESLKNYWSTNKREIKPVSKETLEKIKANHSNFGKISDDIKKQIIAEYNIGGVTKKQLATKYLISESSVRYIVGKCYKTGFIFLSDQEKYQKRSEISTGRKLSEDHKNKISLGNIGRVTQEETKEKISIANSGDKNGMFCKTHTKETKIKMSEFQKNRKRKPCTDEVKKIISDKLKGRVKPKPIDKNLREDVITKYLSGNFTKKQLAELLNIKYNTVVNILRKITSK